MCGLRNEIRIPSEPMPAWARPSTSVVNQSRPGEHQRRSIALGIEFQWNHGHPVVFLAAPITGSDCEDAIPVLELGADFRRIQSGRSGVVGTDSRPRTPRPRRFVEVPNRVSACAGIFPPPAG